MATKVHHVSGLHPLFNRVSQTCPTSRVRILPPPPNVYLNVTTLTEYLFSGGGGVMRQEAKSGEEEA